MRYEITRHVGYAGKIRDPEIEGEKEIVFKQGDDAIRDRLIEVGAVVAIAGKATADPGAADKAAVEKAEADKAAADKAAAEKAAADKAAADKAAASKPLAEQSFAELKVTAKAEKVPAWGPIKDEAKLRAAIEARRAAKAKA